MPAAAWWTPSLQGLAAVAATVHGADGAAESGAGHMQRRCDRATTRPQRPLDRLGQTLYAVNWHVAFDGYAATFELAETEASR
jgi:hypothetical protein